MTYNVINWIAENGDEIIKITKKENGIVLCLLAPIGGMLQAYFSFLIGGRLLICVFIGRGGLRINSSMFFAISFSPELVLHQITKQNQMDSFNYIIPTEFPTDKETGGSVGNAYCAVAHTTTVDVPTNAETRGSGGNAYCVVA